MNLPIMFLKFWFLESPVTLFQFFMSLNASFLHLFSLPLFLRTFFKPLKNEYRPGLVKFSRALGMVIKSFFIVADLLIFSLMLTVEFIVFVGYLFFPFATILLLVI